MHRLEHVPGGVLILGVAGEAPEDEDALDGFRPQDVAAVEDVDEALAEVLAADEVRPEVRVVAFVEGELRRVHVRKVAFAHGRQPLVAVPAAFAGFAAGPVGLLAAGDGGATAATRRQVEHFRAEFGGRGAIGPDAPCC